MMEGQESKDLELDQEMQEMFTFKSEEEIEAYKDTVMKVHQLVANLSESIPFKVENPSMQALLDILQIWRARRNFGEDKTLTLEIDIKND